MQNKIPFEVIIREASAGTGKTYSIIEDIFNLKKEFNSYEFLNKIAGITFSESAAIELKERLIKEIMDKEYKNLSNPEKIKLENILLKLKFSTIHSFAKKILKRFAFMLEIDPFFKVIEDKEGNILFSESLNKTFSNPEKTKVFYEIAKEMKLNQFSKIIYGMKKLHPYVFLGTPSSSLTKLISEFFKNVDEEYFNLKKEFGYLDFDDLEKLTYILLNEKLNPESLLILEDFDEKMNFIFLDEFQDTNLLQWKIIESLINEWLSGYGSKAETGEKYGIYIVGDKKQSIYKFRGAESSLIDEVKEILKDYHKIEKLQKNYRSTKKIIDFVNAVFKDDEEWLGEELVSDGKKEELPSKIEIAFFDDKEKEYEWVCNKICSFLKNENIIIYDKKIRKKRRIELKDIFILIRKRNKNFKLLEEKLKNYNIPYVVIGGIGFYQEPEIKLLLSLVYALVDPTDKFAIWNLKNSIFKIDSEKINKWRNLMDKFEFSFLIEKILDEINFWENLNTQQTANVEKFLSILQNQSYLPYHQIAKNFRELSKNTEEPKADVFSVHQNAVKILTIHRAKGLESPAVFLLNIEDITQDTKNDLFFYKKQDDKYLYVCKNDSSNEFRNDFKKQMQEEENRLLYVALTRAMQFLFISGKVERENAIIKKIKKLIENYPAEIEEKKEPLTIREYREKGKIGIQVKFKPFLSFTKEKGLTYSENIIGSIIHKIINEISNGTFEYSENQIKERAIFYLKKATENPEIYENKIFEIFNNIRKNKEIEKIITERISDKVKSEYPFICEINGETYEGVIDKIFIEKEKVKIYEFKVYLTNPENYKKQLEIYSSAVKKILNPEKIECFIINLSKGEIIKFEENQLKG